MKNMILVFMIRFLSQAISADCFRFGTIGKSVPGVNQFMPVSPFGGGWREATGEDLGGWGAGRAGYGLWEKTGDGEWWIVRVSRAGDRR
jgi:hypothetical protein